MGFLSIEFCTIFCTVFCTDFVHLELFKQAESKNNELERFRHHGTSCWHNVPQNVPSVFRPDFVTLGVFKQAEFKNNELERSRDNGASFWHNVKKMYQSFCPDFVPLAVSSIRSPKQQYWNDLGMEQRDVFDNGESISVEGTGCVVRESTLCLHCALMWRSMFY